MSLISLKGIVSTSAPSKAQKDAAIYMFGSKGHAIVAVLDKFSRAKELFCPHIDGLLALMKDGEDDEIIKFTSSAAGKKTIVAAKAFATAKTLATSIKSLKLIRVPAKWVAGHSDAAAARIQETTTIRARKSSAGKPEKPIKMDNPGAPESQTTLDIASTYDAAQGSKTSGVFYDVNTAVSRAVRKFGLKTEMDMNSKKGVVITLLKDKTVLGRIGFPSNKRKLKWQNDDPNMFFMQAINDEESETVMDYYLIDGKGVPATVARYFVSLWQNSEAGEWHPGKESTAKDAAYADNVTIANYKAMKPKARTAHLLNTAKEVQRLLGSISSGTAGPNGDHVTVYGKTKNESIRLLASTKDGEWCVIFERKSPALNTPIYIGKSLTTARVSAEAKKFFKTGKAPAPEMYPGDKTGAVKKK